MDPISAGMVFQERYEILSKLGEGGFGKVYRARQRVTRHEVAVKVLHALHSTDEKRVARFQREMQLCAQLYHPNIVRLIDSGKVEPDLLYTVFEYVPGRTLADVLAAEGALEPWDAAHLMLQVLDALGCAHKSGVIHRDLKPQNIMVTHTGARRNALVLDFGLGTLSSEGGGQDQASITLTQEVLGTPAYAAPEQLRGDAVTTRSDLYSWGLIFLECLTGQRVVEGATLQQMIYKQIGPEPIPLPAWLEDHRLGRLLRKVTQKAVTARDVSAESVLKELEACVAEGWPTSDGRPGAPRASLPADADTIITRIEGERRQLTAVCCSLRLSGAEGMVTDEEDLDRLLRSLHAACADIARRHEAHVGSLLGEWMLFYFGYPRAQEDDARRAARTALQLVAEMERRGAELARERKGHLEVRVGLHTGFVISREPRARGAVDLPALVGTTPNIAVGLEARAEPGTILISEVTSKLLRGHFAFEPAGAGQAGPRAVPAFRLLHEYRALSTPQRLDSPTLMPLYGRAQELELLQQRWWQVAAGTGQSLLVSGESGIGKSRLVQELTRQLRSTPQTLLECRCTPEGRNSALSPVVDLLERLLGVSRDWTAAQTTSALEALLSQHGLNLDEVMPLFLGLLSVPADPARYPPPEVSPQRLKELTFDALTELLFEMAQQHPLLLVVEDLHWADPSTLELLAQLVKEVSSAPIFLVLTARPEFSTPWTTGHHVQLGRLDRQRVEEMVGGLTQGRALPREVVEQLVNRTDGVPLFVEELTRVVAESLPARGDTPGRMPAPSQITVPSTLRDSLMARLDRLGPAKEVAQLAAALGREFSYEVLKAVLQRGEAELQRELKALVDADLVHRRRGTRNPTYVFKHALIRDTAYESMLKPMRRQVHARIASTLEAHFPELTGTRPDLLAMHHAAADQKRQAMGWAQRAGLAALMRSANHEATAHLTEALGWLDAVEEPLERAELELGLNSLLIPALMATRGFADERIKERVERSQQLIDFLGDSPQTVPTLWGLTVFHHTRGDCGPARALVERLLTRARLVGDENLGLMALTALGQCQLIEGQLVEAQQSFDRVTALYDASQHLKLAVSFGLDARVWTEGCMSLTLWIRGYLDQAATRSQEGLRWAQETKHASSLGLAYLYRLTALQGRGEREPLLAEVEGGLEMSRRYGLPAQLAYCQMLRSWAARDAEGLRQAIAAQVGAGLEIGMSYYKSLLADVEVEAGRHDAALPLVEEVLGWARARGEGYMLAELLRLKGLSLRGRGELAAAEACLREAIVIAREQSAKMLELKAATALGELLQDRGQVAEARQMLAPVVQWFTEGLDTPYIVRAKTLLSEFPA